MKTLAVAMMLSFGLATAVTVQAQEPDPVELVGLDLKVVSATVVPELARGGGLVSANPGYRLVTVKMAGSFKKPGRVLLAPSLFSVMYEEHEPPVGETRTKSRSAELVLAEGATEWSKQYDVTAVVADPVVITFAVSMPVAVRSFSVLVATAIGKTEIAAP